VFAKERTLVKMMKTMVGNGSLLIDPRVARELFG
jgi:hypothetical protein